MNKEQFWGTPVINEHGLKCPVPAEFWPHYAYYATFYRAGKNGFIEFWEAEPTLKNNEVWIVNDDTAYGRDNYWITSLFFQNFNDFPNPDEKYIWKL
jgi:hypothetical protein